MSVFVIRVEAMIYLLLYNLMKNISESTNLHQYEIRY